MKLPTAVNFLRRHLTYAKDKDADDAKADKITGMTSMFLMTGPPNLNLTAPHNEYPDFPHPFGLLRNTGLQSPGR